MSDWTDRVKQAEQESARTNRIEAERSVNEERRYQALVSDWWTGLLSKIQEDAIKLGAISITRNGAWTIAIQKNHPTRIVTVGLDLMPDARKLKVIYTHSDDGVDVKRDGIENLGVRLNATGRIELHGSGAPLLIVDDISQYLLTRVLQPDSGPVQRWSS